jgi:hypothetical protein
VTAALSTLGPGANFAILEVREGEATRLIMLEEAVTIAGLRFEPVAGAHRVIAEPGATVLLADAPITEAMLHDGDVLKISAEGKLSPSSPIRVHVYAPDIENLEVSGAANVVLNDIDNQALSIDSSGASKIKLAGDTAKLTIDVSGATKVEAEDLNTADADVDASGASHISVNVSGSLRADASGASRVVYSGKPESIEKKTSGGGSVTPK